MGEEAFLGEEGGEWEPLSYLGIWLKEASVAHEESIMSPLVFWKNQGLEDLTHNPRYDIDMVLFHKIGSLICSPKAPNES